MTNKLSKDAFNNLLLQIVDKKVLYSINMINAHTKIRIEKCIALTNEEYSYAMSLQAVSVADFKRIIIESQKRLEGLEALITISKLIISIFNLI